MRGETYEYQPNDSRERPTAQEQQQLDAIRQQLGELSTKPWFKKAAEQLVKVMFGPSDILASGVDAVFPKEPNTRGEKTQVPGKVEDPEHRE